MSQTAGVMNRELMTYKGASVYFDPGGDTGEGTSATIESILGGKDSVADSTTEGFADISSKVNNVGRGAYHIMFAVAIFVFVIGLVIAGISVFFSNAANRSEQKSNLIWKVVGVIVAMGAVSIIIFLATAAGGIF